VGTAGSIRMSAAKRLPKDKKEVVEKSAILQIELLTRIIKTT